MCCSRGESAINFLRAAPGWPAATHLIQQCNNAYVKMRRKKMQHKICDRKSATQKVQCQHNANQPLHLKSSPWLASRHSHMSSPFFQYHKRKYKCTQIHTCKYKHKYTITNEHDCTQIQIQTSTY